MKRPREEELVVSYARDGNTTALEQLIQRHYPKIFQRLTLDTGNAQRASDMARHIFARLIRESYRYDGRLAFSSWWEAIIKDCLKQDIKGSRSLSKQASKSLIKDLEQQAASLLSTRILLQATVFDTHIVPP